MNVKMKLDGTNFDVKSGADATKDPSPYLHILTKSSWAGRDSWLDFCFNVQEATALADVLLRYIYEQAHSIVPKMEPSQDPLARNYQ